jgi:hypothetical protein
MLGMLLDFEWYRDSAGYRLVRSRSLVPAGHSPESYPDEDWIVARGGKWVPYRPFEHFETLYAVFANVRTKDDLLSFIQKFGPLSRAGFAFGESGPEPVPGGPTWGDSVPQAVRAAQAFRDLLHLKRKGPKAIASYYASKVNNGSRFQPGARWVGETDLIADSNTGVRVKISTNLLISALWLQLGQKLSGDTNFQMCRQCGDWFETGALAGRRADARFCSDEHRIRFNSFKRTRGG